MAIDDLIVLVNNSSVPLGYQKIDRDLNEGAGGRYLYYAFHEGNNNPITAPIEMIYGDTPELWCQASFDRINVNLNM